MVAHIQPSRNDKRYDRKIERETQKTIKEKIIEGIIMAIDRLVNVLDKELQELKEKGTAKGKEFIITKVKKPEGEKGTRYFLKGKGDQEFLRMNSNSYLGMSLRKEIIEAEEHATREYGVGPGAVRFINGTFKPHRELEKALARFHGREDAMIYSAAYATTLGVLSSFISKETTVISDDLNHNCIINAIRLSKPLEKKVYKHLDMNELESLIKESIGKAKRVLVVTDGIFSMRGDYGHLDAIMKITKKYDNGFPENILVVADDSHGIGAFGKTGRGTEEYVGAQVDVLIGTLGKAFGVNGGYITSNKTLVTYLREKAVTYIYSNPITCGEAMASLKSLAMLDSDKGNEILKHLREMTKRFEKGVREIGFEIIKSDHPIVPLMIRDTEKTRELVRFLNEKGILSTGLTFPVVPKGDDTIRFQINADHTQYDIDYALGVLKEYKKM
ncbi:MAG: aminotransferase class I/II-fold pyridoxal phosphate-dependent enzyme [Spirochaetales bacterium]|nr:aminotransferase class I/II-fold pyridoxal phosphate-dependent enzyme [Spirochaetales bacterium]